MIRVAIARDNLRVWGHPDRAPQPALTQRVGGLVSSPAADNPPMSEWMRLGAAAGTVMVALACILTAAMTHQDGLRSSRGSQRAFGIAAVLLVGCIPLVALDGAGALGPLSTSALALAAAAAIVLVGVGRRCVTGTRQVMPPNPAFGLGAAHIEAVPPVTQGAPAVTSTVRTAQLRVPVLLFAVTDDGYRVELNQN